MEQKEANYQEDEISLGDIYRILKNDKKIIIIITSLFVLVGLVYSFLRPEVYEYKSCISLGISGYSKNGSPIYFDPPDNVIARINSGIIPSLLDQLAKTNKNILFRTSDFKVENTKGSSIVCINKTSTKSKSGIIKQIENDAANAIVSIDRKLSDVQSRSLQTQVQDIKASNAALTTKQEAIKTTIASNQKKLKLIAAKRSVVSSESAALNAQIEKLNSLLSKAMVTANSSTEALAGMMQGNQIAQLQNQLYQMKLEEASNIPQQELSLADSIKNDLLKLSTIDQQILLNNDRMAQVQAQIHALQPTEVIRSANRSMYPVGPGKMVIVVLALFLGFGLSVMVVFLRHAIDRS